MTDPAFEKLTVDAEHVKAPLFANGVPAPDKVNVTDERSRVEGELIVRILVTAVVPARVLVPDVDVWRL